MTAEGPVPTAKGSRPDDPRSVARPADSDARLAGELASARAADLDLWEPPAAGGCPRTCQTREAGELLRLGRCYADLIRAGLEPDGCACQVVQTVTPA